MDGDSWSRVRCLSSSIKRIFIYLDEVSSRYTVSECRYIWYCGVPNHCDVRVTKNLSLCAVVECGLSNNFLRRQSLEAERPSFVDGKIRPTRTTVILATGASITVKKRVVGIHYKLEDK